MKNLSFLLYIQLKLYAKSCAIRVFVKFLQGIKNYTYTLITTSAMQLDGCRIIN